jgi:2-alkyl-3-oxoalkanoate reductase
LRPHLIWGRRDKHLFPRLVARAKSGRLRIVGSGSNRISTVHVATAAAAHLQAADRLSVDSPVAGKAYFVNDTQPVEMWPWIDRILGLAGLPPVRKRIGLAAAYRAGAVLEGVYRVLGLRSEPPMTRFLALQLGTSHFYSTARAERDFGFQPVVDPDVALEGMADELRALC